MNSTACNELVTLLNQNLLNADSIMKTINFSKNKHEQPWCQLAVANIYRAAIDKAESDALTLLAKYVEDEYIQGTWPDKDTLTDTD